MEEPLGDRGTDEPAPAGIDRFKQDVAESVLTLLRNNPAAVKIDIHITVNSA
ncbi:MAG: hypothetical protein WA459_11635 [Stellaceae bacterium]